jgi:hypothetical protein
LIDAAENNIFAEYLAHRASISFDVIQPLGSPPPPLCVEPGLIKTWGICLHVEEKRTGRRPADTVADVAADANEADFSSVRFCVNCKGGLFIAEPTFFRL